MNRATLIGHAGKDAEVRYTGNGRGVASFSLATNESWQDKATGQWQEKTDWHNITAWGKLAEYCGEHVRKGKRLFVEGPIQTRSYDGKDGQKKYFTEIVANEVSVMEPVSSAGGQGGAPYEGGGGRSSDGGNQGGYRASAPAPASGGYAPQPDYEPQSAPIDDLPF